ncbi:MAG: hypothetical protein ACK5IC_06840 [Moheibacter sp.]
MMKRFIFNLFKFSVFTGLFYIIIISLWSWIMPPFMAKNVRNCIGCYGHLNTRVKEIPNYQNIDILILGSSHAYRGFDTRIFKEYDLSIFNLGSSSQSPIQTNILLSQYLDQLTPKLVILEVYAGTLEIDGVESSLDLAANNKVDYNYLKTLPDLKNIQSLNSAIYGIFREKLGLNKEFIEDSIQGSDQYIQGGYVETKFRKNSLIDEEKRAWRLNPTQLSYLKKNIQLLESKHIPFILVQTPITQKLYNHRTNHNEVDSLLSSLGRYKNFQGELDLNDTIDFYDSNHLNQLAVKRFNEYFIEYLKKNNFINNIITF